MRTYISYELKLDVDWEYYSNPNKIFLEGIWELDLIFVCQKENRKLCYIDLLWNKIWELRKQIIWKSLDIEYHIIIHNINDVKTFIDKSFWNALLYSKIKWDLVEFELINEPRNTASIIEPIIENEEVI